MLLMPPAVRIFVCAVAVDLRKGHDGLTALVGGMLGADPYSGHLFVFHNRRRTHVKILWWDRGGFAIFFKRLERGVFRFPAAADGCVEIEAAELALLLEGISLDRARRQPRWTPHRHAAVG